MEAALKETSSALPNGIKADLAWLGLTWDLFDRQSLRLATYDAAADSAHSTIHGTRIAPTPPPTPPAGSPLASLLAIPDSPPSPEETST